MTEPPTGSPPETPTLRWLGRIGYGEALALQEKTVEQRALGEVGDVVFLLEHDPVYTIGRTPDRSSLGESGALPHPVVVTNRGGQATFHGPGQLVAYPVFDLRPLRQDLHRYLRALESAVIDICARFGVAASSRDGLTGAWVDDRKIASIGVGVRRWITMHGFALNVRNDLGGFAKITPCGIGGVEMTSLEQEAGREISVEEAAEIAAPILAGLPRALADG